MFHVVDLTKDSMAVDEADFLFMANKSNKLLLYLYRARNKITQLSIPTHAQLQRHRLKFIKNHLKTSYMLTTALARTRTLRRSSGITQYKQHDMLPHHHS